jgi:hypothetical protein
VKPQISGDWDRVSLWEMELSKSKLPAKGGQRAELEFSFHAASLTRLTLSQCDERD